VFKSKCIGEGKWDWRDIDRFDYHFTITLEVKSSSDGTETRVAEDEELPEAKNC